MCYRLIYRLNYIVTYILTHRLTYRVIHLYQTNSFKIFKINVISCKD